MSSPIDTRPPHGHGMQRKKITPRREDLSRRTPCPYDEGCMDIRGAYASHSISATIAP
jgi:hypothetical protein